MKIVWERNDKRIIEDPVGVFRAQVLKRGALMLQAKSNELSMFGSPTVREEWVNCTDVPSSSSAEAHRALSTIESP